METNSGTIEIKNNSNTAIVTAVGDSGVSGGSTSTSSLGEQWSYPTRIDVHEYQDRIEILYKQTSIILISNGWGTPPPSERVYKIIFSCVDGKWNKSEPIYGKIIAPQDETYEFED